MGALVSPNDYIEDDLQLENAGYTRPFRSPALVTAQLRGLADRTTPS